MKETSRRDFIRHSTATAVASMTAASWSRVLGANDRLNMGLIGCGGRGKGVASSFNRVDEIQWLGVCDVYDRRRREAITGPCPGAREYLVHTDLLEKEGLDAVLIATPDHWHAPTAIDALNAGKHVYVEKPLTYTIEEGNDIINAARRNNRICQVGMQQRSGAHYKEAKEKYIDSGAIGKVTLVKSWWHGNGAHLRRSPEGPQPDGLDWIRFIGNRPWREWNPPQFYNFRAYLDFGGGQITDLFTHWIDVIQWFMNEDRPVAAVASGGVYNYRDGRNAPDTICVLNDYAGGWTATFEATLAPGLGGYGIEFVGTQGRLTFNGRNDYVFTPVGRNAEPVQGLRQSDLTEAHVANFILCTQTGDLPNGDVLIGHRSAVASHLGNIAYLEQRRIRLDPLDDEIIPD